MKHKKGELRDTGYPYLCEWCEKNETMDDTSRCCNKCLDDMMYKRGQFAWGSSTLVIYDKV